MKIKALVTKTEPREFVHIDVHENLNICSVGTSSIPRAMMESATMEGLMEYYESIDIEVDLSEFELVEFELVEKNTIGADIRNKLSPCLNLAEMVQAFLDEEHPDKKNGLKELIYDEIKQSKKSVEYIANLL
jgi:hypothetical protein